MAGPQLDLVDNCRAVERVIDAFWALIKKKGRRMRLRYKATAWEDSIQSQGLHAVQGFIISFKERASRRVVQVVAGEQENRTIMLVCGDDSDFTESGLPRRSPGSDRVKLVSRNTTPRERAKRDRTAAQLMFTALQFGNFDPDIVQRIGSLAPGSPRVP